MARKSQVHGSPGSAENPRARQASRFLAVAVFIFFYFYVWLQIDPALQYHAAGPVFFFGVGFLKEFVMQAGGLVEYGAAFLAQCNQVSWLGALLLTAGAFSMAWVTRRFLRRTTDAPIQSAHWVPAFFLLLLLNQYGHPSWRTILGLLLSLCFVLGYVSLPLQSGWLRLTVFGALSPLLYYVAGTGSFLLWTGLGAIFESVICRRRLLGAGCLILGGAVPGVVSVLFDTNLAGEIKRWILGEPNWPAVALYLFFPLATLAVAGLRRLNMAGQGAARFKSRAYAVAWWLRTDRSGRLKPYWHAAPFVLTVALAFLTFDADRKALLQVDYFASQGKWDQVLQAAPQVRVDNVSAHLQVNRALFHSGRMASELFAFRQWQGLELLPGLEKGLDHCRAVSGTLLELGQVNLAEHFAHEALEREGDRPAILLELARINVLKNRPQAARVFLNVLRKAPFHREQAGRRLRELETDPRWQQQEEIARIRPLMVSVDYDDSRMPTELLLDQLLQANRRNRMAFEYLMAHFLLTFQLDKVVENIGRLNDFDYRAIPRHYEEALLLHQRLKGGQKIDLRGRPIDLRTEQEFEQFQAQTDRFQGRLEEGRAVLARDFGQTYWFYFIYAQTLGQQPSAIEETEQ